MVTATPNRPYDLGARVADANEKYFSIVRGPQAKTGGRNPEGNPLLRNYEAGKGSEATDPADLVQCCVTSENLGNFFEGAILAQCELKRHEPKDQLKLIRTAVKSMSPEDFNELLQGNVRAPAAARMPGKNTAYAGAKGISKNPLYAAMQKKDADVAYLMLPVQASVKYGKNEKTFMSYLMMPVSAAGNGAQAYGGSGAGEKRKSPMYVPSAAASTPMAGYVTYKPVEAKCGCEKSNHDHK